MGKLGWVYASSKTTTSPSREGEPAGTVWIIIVRTTKRSLQMELVAHFVRVQAILGLRFVSALSPTSFLISPTFDRGLVIAIDLPVKKSAIIRFKSGREQK